MNRFLLLVLIACFAAGAAQAEPSALLPKAPVLPLALDDSVQFRKQKIFLNDSRIWKSTQDDMINFERLRANYGAVNQYDRRQRMGHYYTFFWRTKRQGDFSVRFEYRQEKLGSFVQAQELNYKDVKGSVTTKFNVIGDDYEQDGRVTAWRVLVIENGRIVALNQSYLWR